MTYLQPTIIRVELSERPVREWAAEARRIGHKVRVHRRSVSAEGLSVPVWVCVVELRKRVDGYVFPAEVPR